MAKRKAADSGDQGSATTNRRSSRRKTSNGDLQAAEGGDTKPSSSIQEGKPPRAAKTKTPKTENVKRDAMPLPKVPIPVTCQAFDLKRRPI